MLLFALAQTPLYQIFQYQSPQTLAPCKLNYKGGGAHLYFRLDIILVKGLSKHTLNMYFSGMKIDPKYAFLHVYVFNLYACLFQNLSI